MIEELIKKPILDVDQGFEPRVPTDVERKLGFWINHYIYNDHSAICPYRVTRPYLISCVIEGQVCFYSPQSGERHLTKGDVFITHPGIPHAFVSMDSDQPWARCGIGFLGPFADTLESLGFLSKTNPVFHDGSDLIYGFFKQLRSKGILSTNESALWRMNRLVRIIYSLNEQRVVSKQSVFIQEKLEEILLYISKHVNDEISPLTIASQFNMSYSHLRRIFKEKTGMSIKAYMTRLKIETAKEMLQNGALSIKEIAGESGFRGEFYFMRVFKQVEGVTPTQYRKYSI